MVDVITNLSEIVSVLPPEIAENLAGLIIVLKAVGIAFIVYVIYLVTMVFVSFYRVKKLRLIEKKVNSIDKKLNKLLKSKKK